MLTEVRRPIHEQNKNFNKKIENIRKYQTQITELNTTVTELKNSIREVQWQTKSCRRNNQQTQRQGDGIHPIMKAKRKK